MKWFAMIIAEINGEFTVNVLSAQDTIAGCHVIGTFINFENACQ